MLAKFSFAGSESKYKEPDAEPAGFWAGIWHGSIMPLALIVSLFKPGVGIYETHNTGKGYNIGYLIGASMAFGKKGIKIVVNGDDEDENCEDEGCKSDEA